MVLDDAQHPDPDAVAIDRKATELIRNTLCACRSNKDAGLPELTTGNQHSLHPFGGVVAKSLVRTKNSRAVILLGHVV